MLTLLDRISSVETTLDEEDSWWFLKNMQFQQDWNCYSSKNYSLDIIVSTIELFVLSHAKVQIPMENMGLFWSPNPIGIFKYRMLEDGSWSALKAIDVKPGYNVQGAYWSNGFYYLVSSDDFLLEANLFVDHDTKEKYKYS